jgi:hypothetical protein
MPQFDSLTFISQLFWLTISFCLLYQLVLQLFLPRLSVIFKVRRIVLQNVFGSGNSLIVVFAQAYFNGTGVFNLLLSQLQNQVNSGSFSSTATTSASQKASSTSTFINYYLGFLLTSTK